MTAMTQRSILSSVGAVVLTTCMSLTAKAQDPVGSLAAFTYAQELEIRNEILVRNERGGGSLDDPILSVYLNNLGNDLAKGRATVVPFQFFWLENNAINAMAMPGSIVGINTGLMTATSNEGELAGVLAHEIAHVTERHLARRQEWLAQTSTARSAVMIASTALAVLAGEAGQAAMVGALGAQAQANIDQIRLFEYEADDEAVKILRARGYATNGFAQFFVKLSRQDMGLGQAPAFLRTHPMPLDRAVAASDRPSSGKESSQAYELAKIRVIGLTNFRCFEQIPVQGYQYGLSAAYANYWRGRCSSDAGGNLPQLAMQHWMLAAEHAESLLNSNQSEALKIFVEKALKQWPNNEALIYYYTRAGNTFGWSREMMQASIATRIDEGSIVLPEIYKDYAAIAGRSGEMARELAARANHSLRVGQVYDAMNQFRQAMQHAGTVGGVKASWVLAINDLHQRYGL